MNKATPWYCRFTEFARLADAGDHIGMGDVGAPGGEIVLRDCLLRGGNLYCWAVDRMSPLAVNVNNCLFERANLYCYTYSQELLLEARNNLFWSNSISLDPYLPNATFLWRDNFFAGTALYQNANAQPTHSHNAYYQGAARLTPNGSGDVLLTSPFVFQTGPLGDYYQGSTDLINQGSRSAIEAGLACATTRTDHQPDEGFVDIGLHYRLGGTLTAEPLYVEAYCASTAIDLSEGVQGCAYGYEIATPPEHGTLSGTPPIVTYMRPENYTGGDGFTHYATDGVMEVEVSVSIWTQNQPPTADGSTIPVCKETATVITLRGSDPCDEPLTFDIVTGPGKGPNDGQLGPITQVNNTTATVTYTPNTSFTSYDWFTFTVSDGVNDSIPATVWLDVNRPNPLCQSLVMPRNTVAQPASVEILLRADRACAAPFAFDIASGPSQGQLGAITPVDGTSARVTYTPDEDFEGTDVFDFVLKDGEWESQAAEVTVHVVSAPDLSVECRQNRIVLRWTVSEEVEQPGLIHDVRIYRCEVTSGDCVPTELHQTVSDPAARMYVDPEVEADKTYCYRVTFRHQNACPPPSTPEFSESPFSNPDCAQTCPPPLLGPVDVAFIVDNTASMAGALTKFKQGIVTALDDIAAASEGDYRLALVTTDTEQVNVRLAFTTDRSLFEARLDAVGIAGGLGHPESTDECLNTVVNALAADGRINQDECERETLQIGDFTGFRSVANIRRLVVLVTDNPPGAFCDDFTEAVEQRALGYAQDARDATPCIKINAILVRGEYDEAQARDVLQAYASISCGWYSELPDSGEGIEEAVVKMFYATGACTCP